MAWDDLFEEELKEVTVSQYTAAIKTLLEGHIGPAWVLGEVSNLRIQASGHIYFSLKDAGAQLPAVMFRGQASQLRFRLEDGMRVQAMGQISVYEPHGRYQLIVREIKESGQGRLFREFERLKTALAAEGLFDRERKRALPALPLRVAIVTSPTGAALQDFIRILKRREWGGRLSVFPCKVQGAGAAREIAASIELANRIGGYDLLVVARGGGSIEDLWCFNEEMVARAVSKSEIPVVSGVGHEIDFTLSDFAADVRAETPSGAAELISSAYLETMDRYEVARDTLEDVVDEALEEMGEALERMKARLKSVSPEAKLERAFLQLDELGTRLDSRFAKAVTRQRQRFGRVESMFKEVDVHRAIQRCRDALVLKERRICDLTEERVRRFRGRLDLSAATLHAISPRATLERGYALLHKPDGSLATSVEGMKKGDRLKASLKDGVADVSVDKVSDKE